jgi:hypothetical protein
LIWLREIVSAFRVTHENFLVGPAKVPAVLVQLIDWLEPKAVSLIAVQKRQARDKHEPAQTQRVGENSKGKHKHE